jgi:catechol 2,3-dioxygenase-like lactoylglutathione lyase family enzyme
MPTGTTHRVWQTLRPAAAGELGRSIYFRDPDGNLLEFLSTVEDA